MKAPRKVVTKRPKRSNERASALRSERSLERSLVVPRVRLSVQLLAPRVAQARYMCRVRTILNFPAALN